MKQAIYIICECGKDINGFSEQHLKKNLEIHQKFSKIHHYLMQIKKYPDKIIEIKKSERYLIKDLLANHPYMIESLKEIGRVMKTKEEKEIERLA
jgi:hypothetical protein